MAQPGPITITSVRPDLPSQSMSSTTGTCQVCGGGGVAPPSLVKITSISTQYRVSGQSGISLLAWDWDGECDRALPDASVSSEQFWPFGGARIWPSVWAVASNFCPSWLFNQVAIDAEMSTVSWNCWISPFRLGAKAYARKLRNDRACGSHIQFMVG